MDGKRFITKLRLRNLLSFGPDAEEFELQPLNVLIGPNASGKSNVIEAISLLQAAPDDIQEPIRRGGMDCHPVATSARDTPCLGRRCHSFPSVSGAIFSACFTVERS